MTLQDGVNAAGGLTDFAHGTGKITHWDGSLELVHLNRDHKLAENPLLFPGDKVIFPRPIW